MAVTVTAKKFKKPFSGLNGTNMLGASRADIIRSLLEVGYPSRKKAVKFVGRWRERMLVAMATGYLEPNLNTTQYFRNLEQTEKVGVTFLLGQAFTHWYAQRYMGIEYLLHVASLNTCRWASATKPAKAKAGASPPAPKSRPDFIGFRQNQQHVFESKGRIRKPDKKAVAKALGQVSALSTINGKKPSTRCASFFMLKATGAEGLIIDPPGDGTRIGLEFDELEAIAKCYSFFFDGPVEAGGELARPGYVGRVIEDGVFFGLDKRIFSALQDLPASSPDRRNRAAHIFSILSEPLPIQDVPQGGTESSGPDGTLLIDRRPRGGPRRDRIVG